MHSLASIGNNGFILLAQSKPRAFTYDSAGNVKYDARSGVGYGYTYNSANRMESMSLSGVV